MVLDPRFNDHKISVVFEKHLIFFIKKLSPRIFLYIFNNLSKIYLPGVPKKVHKFEIKNLCSENRSISKVSVIC